MIWSLPAKYRSESERRQCIGSITAPYHAIGQPKLGRLQTDRIDLYFIHHFDPLTPIDETLRALDDLVRQGKVLYLGVSNWAAWQIAKALGISERAGLAVSNASNQCITW